MDKKRSQICSWLGLASGTEWAEVVAAAKRKLPDLWERCRTKAAKLYAPILADESALELAADESSPAKKQKTSGGSGCARKPPMSMEQAEDVALGMSWRRMPLGMQVRPPSTITSDFLMRLLLRRLFSTRPNEEGGGYRSTHPRSPATSPLPRMFSSTRFGPS